MSGKIDVIFPGGKRVDAKIGGMMIRTDQSLENGGAETAPEPFQLFLASIATCAGIYAVEFCQAREIPSDGMTLSMNYEFDEDKQLLDSIHIDLKVPQGFPERYLKAVIRVMNLCSVKKNIIKAPQFLLTAARSNDKDG
ncbi:MAG: OsmC family protein [Deltaproteobacteria bacterium]|nr:OsmC family protein [Deltaproteobacteria bacterium]